MKAPKEKESCIKEAEPVDISVGHDFRNVFVGKEVELPRIK